MLLRQNIYCDPSLEPSCRDSSDKGSQCMCYGILNTSAFLELWPSGIEPGTSR